MELAVRKHYSKIGKLGRASINLKYSQEVQNKWRSKGGKKGSAIRWAKYRAEKGVDK